MTSIETTMKIERLKAYYNGLRDGIQMYAHWKDGSQYVGTTGKTLSVAFVELNKEEEKRIAELQDETKNR